MKRALGLVAAGALVLGAHGAAAETERARIVVGSKAFTESVLLGEIIVHLAHAAGTDPSHRRGLGGTRVLWQALLQGEIDVYAEYTGTIAQEILPGRVLADDEAMRRALAESGVVMGRPLGFNNTYAIGMAETLAGRLGIRTLSDLARHPTLRFGFSSEFMERADGWPSLRARYRLPQTDVRGLDHDLAYRGIAAGGLDATDVYTTDAEIPYYRLRVLADDLRHFPVYNAVLVYRADLERRAPELVRRLGALAGRIEASAMARMNAEAKLERIAEPSVAAAFVRAELGIAAQTQEDTFWTRLLRHTRAHLALVAASLLAAIVVAIPLGILAERRRRLGQFILAACGVVQTIPSLALLVFMIPILGIGGPPAIVALFLYSLLPIVRNTYSGLHDIAPALRESAEALGLPASARLRLIELPLAARAIMAGVKTSAVINVGTATLGALIGAGGYGQPILTGIRRDDIGLILEGAVPAALLALIVQGMFELAERGVVARGLRLARGRG